jgi:YD repeat-containing protein
VGPRGERTALGVDSVGYLRYAAYAGGDTVVVSHDRAGLLKSLRDPKGQLHTFAYDSVTGRIKRDTETSGAFTELSRKVDSTGFTSILSSRMGRTKSFQVQVLGDGRIRRDVRGTNGLVTTSFRGADGQTVTYMPDGSVITAKEVGDPRFGMSASITSDLTIRLPSNLTSTVRASRNMVLSNSANIFSVVKQTDSTIVNNNAFVGIYDAAARTYTSVTPEGRRSIATFDANDRRMRDSVAGIAATSYTYDAQGRLRTVDQAGRRTLYAYDAGRCTLTTHATESIPSSTRSDA